MRKIKVKIEVPSTSEAIETTNSLVNSVSGDNTPWLSIAPLYTNKKLTLLIEAEYDDHFGGIISKSLYGYGNSSSAHFAIDGQSNYYSPNSTGLSILSIRSYDGSYGITSGTNIKVWGCQ